MTASFANQAEFDRELRLFADAQVPEEGDRFLRAIGLEGLSRVVLKTPVGNPDVWKANEGKKRGDPGYVGKGYVGGHARRNWQLSLNTPRDDEVAGEDPGGGTTIAAGAAVLGGLRNLPDIWITNNVPYIEALEHGHSKQAPQGMLGVTFAELALAFPGGDGGEIGGAA